METVKITDVKKNERDWYEITLEGDDRVLATQEAKLAELATASIGGDPVEVEVNTRVKGSFTNHYVKSIGGVKGTPPASKLSAPVARPTGGRDATTQERIARQWAIGRSTELLMASDIEFSFPLSDVMLAALVEQAKALYKATQKNW